METYLPLFQEFLSRKEQVLNLEMRLFILIFALQVLFVFSYIVWPNKLKNAKTSSLLTLSAFLVFFFEMVAINGKMGLISMYLRQFEKHLMAIGYSGLVWESKALDAIIFVPGNAFTLPAGLAILTLLGQLFYAFYFTISTLSESKAKIWSVTIFLCLLIILLVAKSLTVDFYRELPNIFQ